MDVVSYLEHFPAEERAERFRDINECTLYDLEERLCVWVLHYGFSYPDEITRMDDVVSDIALEPIGFQENLAETLAPAGRCEEARHRIQRNLERWPTSVQTRILTGDAYEAISDVANALDTYATAADRAEGVQDWEWAADRVSDLFEKTGRSSEWQEFLSQHPRPDKSRDN
jgi:predicted Zn-dependent protease